MNMPEETAATHDLSTGLHVFWHKMLSRGDSISRFGVAFTLAVALPVSAQDTENERIVWDGLLHASEVRGTLAACGRAADSGRIDSLVSLAAEWARPGAMAWIDGSREEYRKRLAGSVGSAFAGARMAGCKASDLTLGGYEALIDTDLDAVEGFMRDVPSGAG